MESKGKKISGLIIAAVALLLVIFLGTQAFSTVPVGHTGILLTFGKVQEGALAEGVNFKMPFVQRIVSIDNRVQKLVVDTEAFSRDIQTVRASIAVNYSLSKAKSFEIYKTVGMNYESVIITPSVNEALKSVSALYTAEELISKRQEVSGEILGLLETKLESYGLDVTAFNIIDFDFSEQYIAAVEDKQVAEQRKKQVEIENSTAVEKAEADKKVKIAAAEAEAEERKLKADAEAYSLAQQRQEITQELLQLRMLEKWDGVLPTYVGGGGSGLDLLLPVESTAPQTAVEETP